MEYFRERFDDDLNAEGELIVIRDKTWSRDYVLKKVDEIGYQQAFQDFVEEVKQNAKEHARAFLLKYGCLERFRRLIGRVRNQSVVPWVGAGMSVPSRFPGWEQFLRHLQEEDPDSAPEMNRLLKSGLYEDAAQLLADRLGQNILDENIENVFGDLARNPCGPILLLPEIFKIGVVTTNFDYTLDQAYELASTRFRRTFAGRDLRIAPALAADDRNCLFRIHGEANNSDGRVLTRSDYDRVYGNEGTLADVLNGLVSNRSLLFLGCSLSVDRPLMALTELKQKAQVQNPRHYAFVPLPPDGEKVARRKQLEAADIHPIWYPNDGEHDQHIEALLLCLMEGAVDA
ncbi:SIR2 family protein [Rhizobium leguminosarum]|uniref:SIR2 family protein n=1 Tax=Rhizobium leguminosarum TaxID=384 RepID=UPI003F980440